MSKTAKVYFGVLQIEFQKRGLLHVHIMIILRSEYKIRNVDQYDKIVRIEISNPTQVYMKKKL